MRLNRFYLVFATIHLDVSIELKKIERELDNRKLRRISSIQSQQSN